MMKTKKKKEQAPHKQQTHKIDRMLQNLLAMGYERNCSQGQRWQLLKAIYDLGHCLGMWGGQRKKLDDRGIVLSTAAIMVLVDENSDVLNEVAAGMILDYYLPHWRGKAIPAVTRGNRKKAHHA